LIQFKIQFTNRRDNEIRVVKHISSIHELFSGISTWFSNLNAKSARLNNISVPHQYLPIDGRKQVIPDVIINIEVVGEEGSFTVPCFAYEPVKRRYCPSLSRRNTMRFRYRLSRFLTGTDSSGPGDEVDALVRHIIKEIINRDFS